MFLVDAGTKEMDVDHMPSHYPERNLERGVQPDLREADLQEDESFCSF